MKFKNTKANDKIIPTEKGMAFLMMVAMTGGKKGFPRRLRLQPQEKKKKHIGKTAEGMKKKALPLMNYKYAPKLLVLR
jgi:hypothetical protein